jgi:outer membrane protein OmpA-like peptidoglycan-associated protein
MRTSAAVVAVVSLMTTMGTATTPARAADPCFNPPDAMVISCLKPGTRGIRLGHAPAAAPSAGPSNPSSAGPSSGRSAPPGPPQTGRVDLSLRFATGSATPGADALRRLDGVGRQLASPELADLRFRIEGHADTTGDPALNMTLSQRRAEAVVGYLVAHFGLTAARLEAVGKGQEDLPVQTQANVPEPRNRVVRIVAIAG